MVQRVIIAGAVEDSGENRLQVERRLSVAFRQRHGDGRFSQTLGTNNDNQQWSWLAQCGGAPCPPMIDAARKALETDPQVRAVYGG